MNGWNGWDGRLLRHLYRALCHCKQPTVRHGSWQRYKQRDGMESSGGLLCPAQWCHRYRKIPVHSCGRLPRVQRDWKGGTVSPGDWGRSWKKQGNTVRAVKSGALGSPTVSLSICRNAALGEKKKNVQDQDTRPVAFQIFHASWSHAGVIIILSQHQMASKPPLPLPRPASTPAPAGVPCLDRCAGARAVRRREPKCESGPHLESSIWRRAGLQAGEMTGTHRPRRPNVAVGKLPLPPGDPFLGRRMD
jgi:hypothetical protein